MPSSIPLRVTLYNGVPILWVSLPHLDFEITCIGLFATGSCDKKVHLYSLADENGSSWVMDTSPFMVHKGSVEDMVFSPQNPNLLATCTIISTTHSGLIYSYRLR